MARRVTVATGKRLADLVPGELADVYVRVDAIASRTSRGGEPYFVLEVSDASGRATARVFGDRPAFEPCRAVERGQAVKVRVEVEPRRGAAASLRLVALRGLRPADGVAAGSLEAPLPEAARALARGAVAFDIETVPRLEAGELPERERAKFLRLALEDARREAGGEEPDDEALERSLLKLLALNPLTCRVVSLAFHAADGGAELAAVACDGAGLEPPGLACDERGLLELFWAVAGRAAPLVGFNSRKFDVPVLLTRSALLGVRAGIDLLGGRHDRDAVHVDLQDLLAARGAAHDRRMSLELAAFAFGIPAKQAGHGSEVAFLAAAGRFDELAAYNLEDARATAELYRRVRGTWLP